MRTHERESVNDATSWEAACFGAGLPQEAERELRLAGLSYADDETAESHLARALALAPWHMAVHIGRYRYYFYKGKLDQARVIAIACLNESAAQLGVAAEWRDVRASDADFSNYEAILPRFYLFTLKAYGYLLLRLGELDAGREVTQKLLELDPTDKLGGKVLWDVLMRMGKDDDYDD